MVLHDFLIVGMAFVAALMLGVKVAALVLIKGDGKLLLRILAIANSIYLLVIFISHLTNFLINDRLTILLSVPGVIGLMALEIVHGVLDLHARRIRLQ